MKKKNRSKDNNSNKKINKLKKYIVIGLSLLCLGFTFILSAYFQGLSILFQISIFLGLIVNIVNISYFSTFFFTKRNQYFYNIFDFIIFIILSIISLLVFTFLSFFTLLIILSL